MAQIMIKVELDATELKAIARELGTSVGQLVWLLYVPAPVMTDHVGLAVYIQNELDFVRYLC